MNSGGCLLNSGNHQEFTENNLLLISPPLHSITLLRTATRSLILPQLTRRVGELPQEVRSAVESLCLEQLENLGEALLDFTSMTNLDAWLAAIADR